MAESAACVEGLEATVSVGLALDREAAEFAYWAPGTLGVAWPSGRKVKAAPPGGRRGKALSEVGESGSAVGESLHIRGLGRRASS